MALTGLTKVTNIGINTTTIPTLGGSRNTGIVTVTNAVSASALNNLSDVTISSASNGQILKHNGSVFVNVAETDTTYSQSSVASGSNVNLRLTDSGGTNDDILITAGSNITFSR